MLNGSFNNFRRHIGGLNLNQVLVVDRKLIFFVFMRFRLLLFQLLISKDPVKLLLLAQL